MRGATAPLVELQEIIIHADCVGLIVQDALVIEKLLRAEGDQSHTQGNGVQSQISKRVRSAEIPSKHEMQVLERLRFVVVLWGDVMPSSTPAPFPVYTYDQCISMGHALKHTFPQPSSQDVATIVYTSGTSGMPKGVELTHGNILYQISAFQEVLELHPGAQLLSLLPPWHIYERAVAYYIFSRGCRVVYSSVQTLKGDLKEFPSEVFVAVPLILETLQKQVQSLLIGIERCYRLCGECGRHRE